MKSNLSALAAGLLFGLGLMLSGMSNPGEVLSFLDWTGEWSPDLIGVLGSAVLVSLVGFQLARRKDKPWFEAEFPALPKKSIDRPLLFVFPTEVRNKGHFPSDQAATKLIWLALRNIAEKWKNPPISRHAAKAQPAIQFEERFMLSE